MPDISALLNCACIVANLEAPDRPLIWILLLFAELVIFWNEFSLDWNSGGWRCVLLVVGSNFDDGLPDPSAWSWSLAAGLCGCVGVVTPSVPV